VRYRPNLVSAIALIAIVCFGTRVNAQVSAARQYYSGWQTSPKSGYSYRTYYHKPSNDYSGYRHHYVIQKPNDPDHCYFYNPYKKSYWGRCPMNTQGKPLYSLLAEKDRKANLEDIPESAFPPLGALPPIPDSRDGVLLDLPPDDLPAGLGLPR
jgi:hypothetical protein